MELQQVIENRRSIRKFKSDSISEKHIQELIEAARLAPSGTNLQPTRYIIIKSEEAREQLKGCTPLPFVSQAPVTIVALIDKQSVMSQGNRMKELREAEAFVDTPLDKANESSEDYSKRRATLDENAIKAYLTLNAAIAIDHITLKATDLGLGTCWVMMFDKEKLHSMLNLEDRYEAVSLIPVGYPDQDPAQRPRLQLEEIFLKEI